MKALVTGVSGFLGFELTNYFIKKKIYVIGLYNTKKPKFQKSKFLKLKKINLINKTFKAEADIIIHCASITPVNSIDDKKLYKNNIKIIKNVLKTSSKIRYFFFMSSMSVYGKISSNVVAEKTPKKFPNYYGKSKLECEKILEKLNKEKKVPVFVFRLPGAVGEKSHSNFITKLVENILNNRPLKISNQNSKFNNIVHSKDIFNFIIKILKKKLIGFHILNLASRNKIKVIKILKFLLNNSNYSSQIFFGKGKKTFTINFSKASKLGFRPKTVFKNLELFFNQKKKYFE